MAHPNLIEEQRMHLVDSSFLVLFGLLTPQTAKKQEEEEGEV